MAVLTQRSFTGGEVTDGIYDRVDLAKYNTSLKRARNTFVHVEGGISNRPGLEFIAEVADSTKVTRLVPFEFNVEQAYPLEFGDLTMRPYKNGTQILETSVTISSITQANPGVVTTSSAHGFSNGDEVYIDTGGDMTQVNNKNFLVANKTSTTFELQDKDGNNIDASAYTAYTSGGTVARVFTLTTSYTENDVFDLKYTQSADVLTVVEDGFDPAEIARTADDAWTISDIGFSPNITPPVNVSLTAAGAGGGTHAKTYEYVVTAVDYNGEESLASEADVIVANSLTVTYGININYSPPNSVLVSAITKANPGVVTTSSAHGFVTGDEVQFDNFVSGMTQVQGQKYLVNVLTSSTFELQDLDGNNLDTTGYGTYTSGGRVGDSPDYYNIYKAESFGSNVYGYIGQSDSTYFIDFNNAPDMSLGPPVPDSPFEGVNNKPSTVNYYQQRRIFAATPNDPQKVFASESGFQNSFRKHIPLIQNDAIQFTIASQKVNKIRHLMALDALILLTSGGEWLTTEGDTEVLSPSTIGVRIQSFNGSSEVPPLTIDSNGLFVQEKGQRVRDLGYTFESDSYTGSDLSILARHLFHTTRQKYTIVDWDYAREPYGLIYAVRSDGKLLVLTYQREHQIWAWTLNETDGLFESVCSVPEGDEDAVYFIVKRTIDGVDRRYVERLHTRQMVDVQDAFFVDSGLTFDNPITISSITQANPGVVTTSSAHGFSNGDRVHVYRSGDFNGRYLIANKTSTTFELQDLDGDDVDTTAYAAYVSGGEARLAVTTVSNLDHLEGKMVTGLVDGILMNDKTVTDGSITLDEPAGVIHVGLAYESEIQTLDIDSVERTVRDKKKNVSMVTINFQDSRGGKAGPDSDRLTEIKTRDVTDSYDAIAMRDYIYELSIKGNWSDGGSIVFKQSDPLPFTIKSITPEFSVG